CPVGGSGELPAVAAEFDDGLDLADGGGDGQVPGAFDGHAAVPPSGTRLQGGGDRAPGGPRGAAPLIGEQVLDGAGDLRPDLALEQVQPQVETGGDPGAGDQVSVVDHPGAHRVRAGGVQQIQAQVVGGRVAALQ